jgi:hypothetical protein
MKLDRAVSKAWASPGERDLARGLGEVRDQVDAAIENMVPEYQSRNAVYRTGIRNQKALTLGTQWVDKADNVELMNVVSKMSPSELDSFRKGFVSQLVTRIRSKKSNRNVAAELLNDKALQERLNIVFGDQDVFDDLMRGVSAEGTMAETAGMLGGSATHRRGMQMDYDPAELATDLSQGAMFGPQAAVGAASRRLPNILARKTARSLAPDLMTQGTPAIDALLERYMQKAPQTLPPWMQTAPAMGAGAGMPSLLGGPPQ